MDIDAAFQDAFAAHKDGRFEDAEAAYAAIVAVAEHPLSLHNLGVLRDEAGRIEDAGDLYRRAAAAAPGFAQAAFDLGCVILAQGRLDEGWPLYENRAGRARMLARDLPEHRLKRGDIVKPVQHHLALDGTEGYNAEVFNALGDTLAVITVPDSALEPLRKDEVLCARVIAAA